MGKLRTWQHCLEKCHLSQCQTPRSFLQWCITLIDRGISDLSIYMMQIHESDSDRIYFHIWMWPGTDLKKKKKFQLTHPLVISNLCHMKGKKWNWVTWTMYVDVAIETYKTWNDCVRQRRYAKCAVLGHSKNMVGTTAIENTLTQVRNLHSTNYFMTHVGSNICNQNSAPRRDSTHNWFLLWRICDAL